MFAGDPRGLLDVAARLSEVEPADQRHRVIGLGTAHAEEQIRGHDDVALRREPLAKTQQLRGDSVAFVDDDDARATWLGGLRSGEESKGARGLARGGR